MPEKEGGAEVIASRLVNSSKCRIVEVLYSMRFLVPDRYVLVNFNGGKIYLNLHESKMMIMRWLNVYEIDKCVFFKDVLDDGMCVIDVGGNKGDFSLLAAKYINDVGRVICIEPEPGNCDWIEKSITANGYKSVSCIRAALSDVDGTIRLYLGEKSGWHSILRNHGQGSINVPSFRLDTFAESAKLPEIVDLIKIDVEGAELQVLHGGANTLKRCRNITVDIHPKAGVDSDEVIAFLKGLGFQLFTLRKGRRTPITKMNGKFTEVFGTNRNLK